VSLCNKKGAIGTNINPAMLVNWCTFETRWFLLHNRNKKGFQHVIKAHLKHEKHWKTSAHQYYYYLHKTAACLSATLLKSYGRICKKNFEKQETVSGSGISWATCKSAPRCREITTPATHHSVFYRLDALPATQPTASKHWRLTGYKAISEIYATT